VEDIKLSDVQKNEIVKLLNERYARTAPEYARPRHEDFKFGNKAKEKFKGKIRTFLSKAKSLPAPKEESEDSQLSLLPAATPIEIYSSLEHLLGPEKMGKFVGSFVHSEIKDSPEPEENTFFTIEGPNEKEIYMSVAGWDLSTVSEITTDHPETKYGNFLDYISDEDRNDIVSKLDFDAEWKQYSDKSGYALHVKAPLTKGYLTYSFNLPEFIDAAKKRLAREQSTQDIDRDELIEKIAEIIDRYAEQESEYQKSDEARLEDADNYPAEDAANNSLPEMKRNLDDEIVEYIDKLESFGVDEDDIKEALIDSGENEVTGIYRVDNAIGSYSCRSEDQIDWSDHRTPEDWLKEAGLPYTESLNDNIALLDDDEVEKLKKSLRECSARIEWDNSLDGYSLRYVDIWLGDNDSVSLIVDPQKFISKAKRMIKDKKLEKKADTSYSTLSKILGNNYGSH
jgi:hypothetical protein